MRWTAQQHPRKKPPDGLGGLKRTRVVKSQHALLLVNPENFRHGETQVNVTARFFLHSLLVGNLHLGAGRVWVM